MPPRLNGIEVGMSKNLISLSKKGSSYQLTGMWSRGRGGGEIEVLLYLRLDSGETLTLTLNVNSHNSICNIISYLKVH